MEIQNRDDAVGVVMEVPETFRIINKVENLGLHSGSPVQKVRAEAAGVGALQYTVQVQDADHNWHLASPPSKLLSNKHLIVPNTEIKDIVDRVAIMSGHPWVPESDFFDGKNYKLIYTSPRFKADVAVGDAVQVGLVGSNTYTGRHRPRVEMFINRLICSNGMIVKDMLFSFTYEASIIQGERDSVWQQELQRHSYAIRNASVNFDKFVQVFSRARSMPVGENEFVEFLNQFDIPDSLLGKITRRFYLNEEKTLFGLINACTYCTWHRGDAITVSDFDRNQELTTGLLEYAKKNVN